MKIVPEGVAHLLHQLGHVTQVRRRLPDLRLGQAGLGRLVRLVALGHAIAVRDARYARLHADGHVSLVARPADGLHGPPQILAGRVCVDHDPVTALAADQVVEGCSERLALDVPQREIDGGDCRHGDGPAPPVGAPVEEVPDVLDVASVLADQRRQTVLFQVSHDRLLAAVQGGVSEAVNAGVRFQLERDEITPRTAYDDFCARDLHCFFQYRVSSESTRRRRRGTAMKPCHTSRVNYYRARPWRKSSSRMSTRSTMGRPRSSTISA